MEPTSTIMAIAGGYALGSVPVSLLVARRHGIDLLQTGDGNPGAWNALEQLGPRRATPAFLGDAAKGLAAALAGSALGGNPLAYAGVAGAMLGHAFPAWGPAHGGKSVMTFVGGGLVLSPAPAAVCLAALAVLTRVRSFAVGARVGVFAFPVLQALVDPPERVAATGGLMAIIGLRFGLAWLGARRRRSAPARSAAGAAPPG